jgi:transcriptional regulator of acetoin/glycerol metabolism
MCDGEVIGLKDIPEEVVCTHMPDACTPDGENSNVIAHAERQMLAEALESTNWNLTRAAEKLGITRSAIRWRIRKYELK